MPCIALNDKYRTILCIGGDIFEYEGYRFEIHRYFGPVRVSKKTGDLVNQDSKFFAAVERWEALPEAERQRCRVET